MRVLGPAAQVMILVVLFFVLLTASALLSAYAGRITNESAGTAAACLLGLVAFFFLVSYHFVGSKEYHLIPEDSKIFLDDCL